ncbi:hypothetical protein, partial [Pseudomonas sp. GM49]|uniref:hypothetical protein n=1 Tax=Pseudomonas sp. GM49 TaxID=1144331 RepID=UPI0006ACF286
CPKLVDQFKLAPTGKRVQLALALALAFDLDLLAPSRGRVEVLRSGQPGMDGGGPTEQDRSEGMPSLGEAPNVRGKSPWLLGAFPSNPP